MDAELLLSEFTGRAYTQVWVGTGNVDIKNPCPSILWLVQSSISRVVRGHKEAKERGLLGRFLFLPCDSPLVPDSGNRPASVLEERLRWETMLERVHKNGLESEASPFQIECTGRSEASFPGAHKDFLENLTVMPKTSLRS